MAQGIITGMEASSDIPDDIWEAALAACQHDSDRVDPYEPQPIRFLQTKQQKTQQERDVFIERVTKALKKLNPQRLNKLNDRRLRKLNDRRLKKQMQRLSPIQRLPSDLILELMRHTSVQDLYSLVNSSAIHRRIFKKNKGAVFRGMETEQFSEWKWLFGNSKHRTSAQTQILKDAMFEVCAKDPQEHAWACNEEYIRALQMIDENNFTGTILIMFLEHMQKCLDTDLIATESYTRTKIARRTGMCLSSLSFQRADVIEMENGTEQERMVKRLGLQWEARSQLIREQPAGVQEEIQSILNSIIEDVYAQVQGILIRWAARYYNNPGNHRRPRQVRKWMSKMVAGLVLEEVILRWYTEKTDTSSFPCLAWVSALKYQPFEVRQLLDRHDEENTDPLEEVKNGIKFGESIGLEMEGIVDGTDAGKFIDFVSMQADDKD